MKDEAFIRGEVPMTKEEVRLLSLARLELGGADTLLDVGAGTGSISIEAAQNYPGLRVIAIEKKIEAVALIRQNQQKFAVSNLEVVQANAPCDLAVAAVDAVFIGGSSGSLAGIIGWSQQLLRPGGRLVLNFILLGNLMEALALLPAAHFTDIDVVQLQVARLTKLGPGQYFKPNNATYIISCRKSIMQENGAKHGAA